MSVPECHDKSAAYCAAAMSEENIEILRRAYAALAEDGAEAVVAFADPDFEMTTPATLASEPDTYRGHEGIRRYFGSFSDVDGGRPSRGPGVHPGLATTGCSLTRRCTRAAERRGSRPSSAPS